ncbi:DUF2384 domain-containing protein [Tardiphaga sp. P9-11]|nr:DUF2384 domain-containing protein [Tardiphaga sp. P9-11]
MAARVPPDLERADICALAADVFGSEEEAQWWLQSPAFGLERRHPVDLLDTETGIELVKDYLIRIDRGVYS